MDMEATPLPPPPPLRTRFAVAKRLPPRSSRKQPADELPLAPLKALKASPGSSAHWVAEAQAAIQHGAASARVNPKEPAAQGGAVEVAPTQTREGVPPPRESEAHGSDGAGLPLVAEAPGVSEAEATKAKAPRTAETMVATVGVCASSEATMAEAGAPETTKAVVMAARPSIQEAEMKAAAEASVAPLVQGPPLLRGSTREAEVYPISSDDTSRAREVVDAKDAESEAEITQAAEASSAVQTVLETEIREHKALKHATLSAYEALEVEGVQSGSSLGSRLIALSN
ncbi:uncharacterized protein [Miscanthus floridulus]|uniref:uncharacterized protein n=1 Tax=Miscanthus floridulus TaxID=154761 RepID=UPI00345837C9